MFFFIIDKSYCLKIGRGRFQIDTINNLITLSVKCRDYSKIPIERKVCGTRTFIRRKKRKIDHFISRDIITNRKMFLVYDPQILNTKKRTFRNNDAGKMFHLYCDVTNVSLFSHQRAPDCAPLVICSCHRIVICKHILLIFSLLNKDIFSYMSLVKSYTQIKRCEQKSRSPRTF
jgi:hypothetical protein